MDSAFRDFQVRLARMLTNQLNSRIQLQPHDMVCTSTMQIIVSTHYKINCQITPYKYLKVNYKSSITWREETNFLRTNPSFNKQPRYDYVLIQVDNSQNGQTCICAQLLEVFGITIHGTVYHIALVLPLDEHIPMGEGHHAHDNALRFTRIWARHRSKAVFIMVESIICGALLAPASSEPEQMDEHLVIDVIDEDMWWRMKSVKLVYNVKL